MGTESAVREIIETTMRHRPQDVSPGDTAEIIVARAMKRLEGGKHGMEAVIEAIKAAFKEGRELA
jgi:hypothetical protein